jgi:hypothetical protein
MLHPVRPSKIGKSFLVLAIDERQSAWINQWQG